MRQVRQNLEQVGDACHLPWSVMASNRHGHGLLNSGDHLSEGEGLLE